MKKLINEVDNIVNEMLDGMVAAYPQYVRRLEGLEVLVRAGGSEGKVALISGGGSGHEPAHGGYVGKGMLDGAVAGAVSTTLFRMTNVPAGAGMGTSGLVGILTTYGDMAGDVGSAAAMFGILVVDILIPIVVALGVDRLMRRLGWVKKGDMRLQNI